MASRVFAPQFWKRADGVGQVSIRKGLSTCGDIAYRLRCCDRLKSAVGQFASWLHYGWECIAVMQGHFDPTLSDPTLSTQIRHFQNLYWQWSPSREKTEGEKKESKENISSSIITCHPHQPGFPDIALLSYIGIVSEVS